MLSPLGFEFFNMSSGAGLGVIVDCVDYFVVEETDDSVVEFAKGCISWEVQRSWGGIAGM